MGRYDATRLRRFALLSAVAPRVRVSRVSVARGIEARGTRRPRRRRVGRSLGVTATVFAAALLHAPVAQAVPVFVKVTGAGTIRDANGRIECTSSDGPDCRGDLRLVVGRHPGRNGGAELAVRRLGRCVHGPACQREHLPVHDPAVQRRLACVRLVRADHGDAHGERRRPRLRDCKRAGISDQQLHLDLRRQRSAGLDRHTDSDSGGELILVRVVWL